MKRIVKSTTEPVVSAFGTRKKVYNKVRELLNAIDELSGVEFEELKDVVGKCVYDNRMKYSGSWDAAPAILNCIKLDEIGTLN